MSNKLPWQGTWNSTYGPLRLVQSGHRVYGDYGDRGPIEGTLSNGTLTGTFKNGSRSGRLEFHLDGEGRFTGKWAWDDTPPSSAWTGDRSSESLPSLKFHNTLNGTPSRVWEGSWNTRFGTVKLVQQGNRVLGDYRDLGPIEAIYTPANRRLKGTFHNNGKPGTFYWELAADEQSFTGKWAWGTHPPNDNWTGKKTSSATPTDLQFVKHGQPVIQPTKPTKDDRPVGDINGSRTKVVPAGSHRSSEREVPGSERTNTTTEGYICTTKKYKVDATFNENYILSATQSNLYPGSIIDGRAYSNGQINPVNGVRQPMRISPSYGGRGTTVSGVSISGVRSALLGTLPTGATPAVMLFNTTTIRSEEDLRVHLKAGYDDGINAIKASGGYRSTDKSNVVAVQFIQLYYTVDVDRPADLISAAVFADGTQISADHLIVDQVGYGRMVNLLVETNYSAQEVEGALKYSGNYGTKKISAELETTYEKVLERSRFTAFVIGGNTNSAAQLIASNGGSLQRFLEQGASFNKQNPGLPIVYKLRFLKDWSEANVLLSTTVTKTECVHTTGTFDTGFDWLRVKEVSDPGDNEEIYGIGWIRCYVTPKGKRSPEQVMPENFRYLDKYGRVYEIKPDNHRSISKGDAMGLMSRRVRFHLEASRYGYRNFDEMKSKAYFEFTFEVKEKDNWGGDDNLGKQSARVYLNEAHVPRVPSKGSIADTTNYPTGLLDDFMDGGSRAQVRYSIEPVAVGS